MSVRVYGRESPRRRIKVLRVTGSHTRHRHPGWLAYTILG